MCCDFPGLPRVVQCRGTDRLALYTEKELYAHSTGFGNSTTEFFQTP